MTISTLKWGALAVLAYFSGVFLLDYMEFLIQFSRALAQVNIAVLVFSSSFLIVAIGRRNDS